jgi:hypothetical protein
MSGSCLCGAVRFTSVAATMFASHCHCETCRRAHAAPFVTWTAVPVGSLRIDGEATLRRYGSSPGVTRSFCGTCGTPLFFWGDDAPDRVYVPAAVWGALDRAVDGHVSYEEHVAWVEGLQGLPCVVGKGEEPLRWR